MARLYEIDQAILDCIDLETGEIIDVEKLSDLQMQREQKIESVVLWIKNLRSDAEAYKAEKEVFEEREKQAKNKAERLAAWLTEVLDGEKFITPKCSVTFRKSEAVEVVNPELVPKEFQKVKVEVSPDKIAIKNALKHWTNVPGCELVLKKNIQIK